MESRSAPPPCACGHMYAVDFVNKHTNTVYQHTTASSSRKHLEWESRGCPIPVPQCGCGESFVPAPMQQHDQIVAKHRGTRRHLDWVAGGEKTIPLNKQAQLSFSSKAVAAPAPSATEAPPPFMDDSETSASAPVHHDNPRSGPSQPTGSPEHGKASSSISSPPLLQALTGFTERANASSNLKLQELSATAPTMVEKEMPCRGVNLVDKLSWPLPFLDHFAPTQLGTAMFLRTVIASDGVLRIPDCTGVTSSSGVSLSLPLPVQ